MRKNFIRGHVQHVISFDDKKELIIGQLHAIQDQWLFLMAFHQSHSSADLAPPQDGPQIEQMVGECRPMRQLKKIDYPRGAKPVERDDRRRKWNRQRGGRSRGA